MNSDPAIDCFCECNEDINEPLIECPICKKSQHIACIPPMLLDAIRYFCLKCMFKYVDPLFHQMTILLPPCTLDEKKNIFKFHTKITSNSIILIRCIKFEDNKYELKWPNNCSITINEHSIVKLMTPQFNEPIVFVQNPSMLEKCFFTNNAFVFTGILFDLPSIENDLTIRLNHNNRENKLYIIDVEQVSILDNNEQIMKYIETVNTKPRMFELLQNIVEVSELINANDIYSDSEPITVPARGFLCEHLSVFDLVKFLNMNENRVGKRCPICQKLMIKIYIDGFIQAKIKEDKYRRNTHYFIKADYSFIEAFDENHQGSERDIKEDNISPNIIIKEDRMDIDEEPVQEMVPKRNQPQRENVVKIPEKKDLRKEVKKKGKKEKNEEREKKINYLFKNVIPHMKYAVFLNDYINKDN